MKKSNTTNGLAGDQADELTNLSFDLMRYIVALPNDEN